jgi:hypothetical protein
MSAAETQIYNALSGAPAVTAYVSTRVYPDQAAEDADIPLIVFDRANTRYDYTIHGSHYASVAQMAISCWASTRISAEAIADTVVAALETAQLTVTTRDGILDPQTGKYAAIVGCEIWE